jgi:hypothetical protein
MGQPYRHRFWLGSFYSDYNNIGDKGCKYLIKTHMPKVKRIYLRKVNVIKTLIILAKEGCVTFPREHGKN